MGGRPDFVQSVALVIGIDAYESGVPPLRTAAGDATRLAEILRDDHGYDVRLLTDRQASGEAITAALAELGQTLGPDDRALFYFAGHGVALDGDDGPTGYLLPQDAVRGEAATYLHMPAVNDALAAVPARHMLVVLDSCFSGAFRWSSTRDLVLVPEVVHQERYDRFILDPAWQALASASHDQTALDEIPGTFGDRGDEGGHSPFARALFDALGGAADLVPAGEGNGVITASELYLYLEQAVQPATMDAGHRQTPRLWPLGKHDKGEFIFLVPGHELNLPPAPPLTYDSNPWRGLESYDEADAELFFGRDEVIEGLSAHVAGRALSAVLGASGTGKSSVVKAGLVPRLKGEGWRVLPVVRPGADPLHAFGTAVATLDAVPEMAVSAGGAAGAVVGAPPTQAAIADAAAVRTALPAHGGDGTAPFSAHSGDGAAPPTHAALAGDIERRIAAWLAADPDRRLALVVDQLEELVTLTRTPAERDAALGLLRRLADDHPDRLRLVLTLRSDFEPQFDRSALEGLWAEGRFVVPPFSQAELREVVEKPASERVMYFDPHGLVDELVEEVIQTPGGLPLLSFALSEMYVHYVDRQSDDRALERADYEGVGGVVGALRTRADAEYDALGEAGRETMRRVMLRMVAAEGGGIARRRVPREELVYPDPAETARVDDVVRRLTAARLVVEGRDDDGARYVEPAHDALVRAWDRLLGWIHAEQDRVADLRFQHAMAGAAAEWSADPDANKGLLWRDAARGSVLSALVATEEEVLGAESLGLGGRVRHAVRGLRRRVGGGDAPEPTWMNARELSFGRRSIRRRTQIRAGLATLVALIVAGATVAVAQRQVAVEARDAAQRSEQAAQDSARVAQQQRGIARDSALAAQQQRTIAVAQADTARANAEEAARQRDRAEEERAEAERQRAEAVRQREEAVRQRNTANARYYATLADDALETDPLEALVLAGQAVAVDDTPPQEVVSTLLAALQSPTVLAHWTAHGGTVDRVEVAASGEHLMTQGPNEVAVWRMAGDRPSLARRFAVGGLVWASISPDGQRVVTATAGDEWGLAALQIRRVADGGVTPLAAEGAPALVAHVFGYEALDPSLMGKPVAPGRTLPVAWGPGGRRIAAVSSFKAHVWDAVTGGRLATFDGGGVQTVAFGGDDLLLLQKIDAQVEARSLVDPSAEGTVVGSAMALAVGPRWRHLALGSDDGLALWSLDSWGRDRRASAEGPPPLELATDELWTGMSEVQSTHVSEDGRVVATRHVDGSTRTWSQEGAAFSAPVVRPDATRVAGALVMPPIALDPAGGWVAALDADGQVRVWDPQAERAVTIETLSAGAPIREVKPLPGERIVTGMSDGTVRIWSLASLTTPLTAGLDVRVGQATPSENDDVLSITYDGRSLHWRASTGEQVGPPRSSPPDWAIDPLTNGVRNRRTGRALPLDGVAEGAPVEILEQRAGRVLLCVRTGDRCDLVFHDGRGSGTTAPIPDVDVGRLSRTGRFAVGYDMFGGRVAIGGAAPPVTFPQVPYDPGIFYRSGFSPGDVAFAVASADRRELQVYDTQTWSMTAAAPIGAPIQAVYPLASDLFVVFDESSRFRVVRPGTPEADVVYEGHVRETLSSGEQLLSVLGVSPDRSRMVSSIGDQDVHLWDPATGRTIAVLDGGRSTVQNVFFAPDGAVWVVDDTGRAVGYSFTPGSLLRRARSRIDRAFGGGSAAERAILDAATPDD